MLDAVSEVLPLEIMLPAPGQGALAVQCRDDADSLDLLAPINDSTVQAATQAERAFLAALGGGCSVPVAAHAKIESGQIQLRGRVIALDVSRQIDVQLSGPDPQQLGAELARQALDQGAADLLENH
jgi:hydroxymethylbilane synthase